MTESNNTFTLISIAPTEPNDNSFNKSDWINIGGVAANCTVTLLAVGFAFWIGSRVNRKRDKLAHKKEMTLLMKQIVDVKNLLWKNWDHKKLESNPELFEFSKDEMLSILLIMKAVNESTDDYYGQKIELEIETNVNEIIKLVNGSTSKDNTSVVLLSAVDIGVNKLFTTISNLKK